MEALKTIPHKAIALAVISFVVAVGLYTPFALGQQAPVNPRSTRSPHHTKPMYFDVLSGETMPQPFVEYEFQNDGKSLKLGNVIIDEKNVSFGLRRLSDIEPTWAITNETYFFVRWPQGLFRELAVELLTRDGNVIWKMDVREADIQKWRVQLRRNVKNPKSNLLQTNWAIEASKANLPLQGLADGFRFCLARLGENAQERLCSQPYVVRQTGTQTLIGRVRESKVARVLLNGEPADLKGVAKAESGMPLRFFAEFATGETLDFTSKPLVVAWSDYTKVDSRDLYTVVGHETPPLGKYRILNPEKDPKWVKSLGFESTIKDPRKFWAVQIKSQEPWLYFPGETGGLFKHPLPTEGVPSSRLRLHLEKRTPIGTYRDGMNVRGRKQKSTLVTSEEYKVMGEPDSEEFTWSFKAKDQARVNRSYVLVTEGNETYRSYFELYKGFSNELSARLSMILSNQGLILMGEAAYNHWFEDWFGWDNYYLTKQRWGISTKYFQSITKYEVSGFGNASLSVLNADLKYRFTPGLWTRDETHGVLFSYQDFQTNLQITQFKVPMAGIGWFWARSMPKVFDELISQLPFMNYPKWVDMEFIYYTSSLDSTKSLNLNFALNFHGQILWKDNFFGEAGFGIKRYDVIDKTNPFQANLGYSLNTLYGTVGLGYKF